jgi:hypothetical protein
MLHVAVSPPPLRRAPLDAPLSGHVPPQTAHTNASTAVPATASAAWVRIARVRDNDGLGLRLTSTDLEDATMSDSGRSEGVESDENEVDFIEMVTEVYEATERSYRAAVLTGSVPYGLSTSTNFGSDPS